MSLTSKVIKTIPPLSDLQTLEDKIPLPWSSQDQPAIHSSRDPTTKMIQTSYCQTVHPALLCFSYRKSLKDGISAFPLLLFSTSWRGVVCCTSAVGLVSMIIFASHNLSCVSSWGCKKEWKTYTVVAMKDSYYWFNKMFTIELWDVFLVIHFCKKEAQVEMRASVEALAVKGPRKKTD